MEKSSSHGVTLLLRRWSEGDKAALNELTPLVYHELHSLASASFEDSVREPDTMCASEVIRLAFVELRPGHVSDCRVPG
jgi:hypothetical protein